MAIKYKVPIPSEMTEKKAQKLYERVRYRLTQRGNTNSEDLLAELDRAFYELFAELKTPMSIGFRLKPYTMRVHKDLYEHFRAVADDLDILFASNQNLTEAATSSFNISAVSTKQLKAKLAELESLSMDLQILDEDTKSSLIIAGDDFVDRNKLDLSKVTGSRCNILPSGHGISLERVGHADVLAPDQAEIRIITEQKVYEGKFYAPLGEAEPEGGKFHWKAFDTNRPGGDFQNWLGELPDDTEQQGRGNPAPNATREVILRDQGASEEELAEVRKAMLDGDPSTYWQVEKTFETPELTARVQELQEQVRNAIERGDPTQTTPTLSTLQDVLNGIENSPLTVTLLVDIKQEKPVSWLALTPFNFIEGQYVEVTNVEIARGDAIFQQAPGFGKHKNETVLTQEANEELQPDEVQTLMTDTKTFAGSGLWTFPERLVRYVRFTLRQPAAHVSPYSVYRLLIDGDVRITKRWQKAGSNKWHEDIQEKHVSTEIELNYPKSVMLHQGNTTTDTLLTPYNAAKFETGDIPGDNPIPFGVIPPVGVTTRLLASNRVKVYNITVETDSWESSGKEEVPKYNIARQAIGIRDLSISQYRFSPSSEIVSQRFTAPKAIRKITLLSNEMIPDELDQERRWIKYWVSVNGGAWKEILPEDPVLWYNKDDSLAPRIINVNSEVPEDMRNQVEGYIETEEEAREVRIKVEITRPENQETVTPILKSYRLKMYCEEL